MASPLGPVPANSAIASDIQRHYEPGLEAVQAEYGPHLVPQVHPREAENQRYSIQPAFHRNEGGGQKVGDSDKILGSPPEGNTNNISGSRKWIRKNRISIIGIAILVIIEVVPPTTSI